MSPLVFGTGLFGSEIILIIMKNDGRKVGEERRNGRDRVVLNRTTGVTLVVHNIERG